MSWLESRSKELSKELISAVKQGDSSAVKAELQTGKCHIDATVTSIDFLKF